MSSKSDNLPAEAMRRTPAKPHVVWWIVVLIVLVLAAQLVHMLLTNPRLEWGVVGHYLTTTSILRGLLVTVELTVLGMFIGIIIGVILAVMRLSPIPVLAYVSWCYIWFFRGTPLLVQIIFWFNLSALIRTLSLGIPFGPSFVSFDTNSLISPFIAGALGLGLNEGAYMAEIVRGGILSVDHGQTEAAISLGMRRTRVMRRIVLPQAMRSIIPVAGNQTISMLKNSSLISVTALPELLYSVQIIYNGNFKTIPLLIVASIWYLVATSVLSIGQFYVERYYARGSSQTLALTPYQKLKWFFQRLGTDLGSWVRVGGK